MKPKFAGTPFAAWWSKVLLAGVALFFLLCVWARVSASGFVYIAGLALLCSDVRWRDEKLGTSFRIAGVLLIVSLAIFNSITLAPKIARVGESASLPSPEPFVEERDVFLGGVRLMQLSGRAGLDNLDVLHEAAVDVFDEHPRMGAPTLSELLGRSGASGFDMEQHIGDFEASETAVLFIHGFGGHVALMCREMARAAGAASVPTYCPHGGARGAWMTRRGRRQLEASIEWVKKRHPRVVVVALSNGAIGVSKWMGALRRDIDSVVLVSGGCAKRIGRPVLVLHGEQDGMTRFAPSRRCAESSGAELRSWDADHFLMLTHAKQVRAELTRFVAARAEER